MCDIEFFLKGLGKRERERVVNFLERTLLWAASSKRKLHRMSAPKQFFAAKKSARKGKSCLRYKMIVFVPFVPFVPSLVELHLMTSSL